MDEVQVVLDINLPSIVGLVETWLNPSIGDSIISLSGYCSYRCDRADGWGGVCVYVNSQIPCKRILSYKSEVESLWLEIRPFRPPRRLFLTFYWVLLTTNGTAKNLALLDLIAIVQKLECGIMLINRLTHLFDTRIEHWKML